uniref:TPR repeat-containing protein n=1 Tax=uncultured bacterium 253 TaxID=698385 RepID=E3T735_9BACT|nr:TPR repeat-containing protein [uncultured bacterium 253]
MSFENSLSGSMKLAHVLFMDIVSYSKLPIDEQASVLHTLQELVRDSTEVAKAREVEQLTSIPTGDGMALVFFNDPTAPVKCALEISRALKSHPEIQIRMGVHSGPVNEIIDVNGRINVAGSGINMAQRVMDSGDAGHILLSKRVAEDLNQYSRWQPLLHDLNEVEVKHAVKVHLFNLYTDEVGNPAPPGTVRKRKKQAVKPWVIAAALAIVIVPIAIVVFLKTRPAAPPARPSKPETEYRTLLQTKADAWADTVFAAQGTDGGIKMSPSSADATTQVWQTAQCLVGVLSLNKNVDAYVPKIKSAFNYLEGLHRPPPIDGWNLYGNLSPYTITEVASWVALANIRSLDSKTAIWNEQEKQEVIKRVVRDLDETIRRQDSGGGWRPIRDENTEFTRTYPTVMALWSLIDAKASPAVGAVVGNKYDEHIRKGINWLLRNYANGQGWVPNPNRSGQREHFEGLTAQALYVLSRAAAVDAFAFIKNESVYRTARQDFLKNKQFADWSIEANDSHLPDADLRFVGTEFLAEGSTFLWFPWTLAELTQLAQDTSMTEDDRQAAKQLRLDIFNQNADKLENYVEAANLMYILGENLYGISVYLNESQNGATP